MTQQNEMENFFGFNQNATQEQKIRAVKKKAKIIEKLEKKESRSAKEQRDIDFYEALGMPKSVTEDKNRKKKQDEEADKSILSVLGKWGMRW